MDASEVIRLINETRHFWLPALDLVLLGLVVREIRGVLR